MNKYDLEQQIMAAWNICEDLDILIEGVMEHDMTSDEIANVLIGMKQLYDLRFNKLFDTFTEICFKSKRA